MTSLPESQTADLRDYIRVVRSRKAQILIVTVAVLAVVLFAAFRQTPVYEGRAQVLVKPIQNVTGTGISVPINPNLDTEQALISTTAVAQQAKKVGHLAPKVDALRHRVKVPGSPASPNKVRDGVLALFAGLLLGIALALVRERLDDRVKSRQEIERRLGAPVIAAVPRVTGWRRSEEAQLVMRADPRSPVSEAYRTLSTNLQYMASQAPLSVIM